MLIWNSNHELDQASISNFKAQGLKIEKGNCSKLSIISDVNHSSCLLAPVAVVAVVAAVVAVVVVASAAVAVIATVFVDAVL